MLRSLRDSASHKTAYVSAETEVTVHHRRVRNQAVMRGIVGGDIGMEGLRWLERLIPSTVRSIVDNVWKDRSRLNAFELREAWGRVVRFSKCVKRGALLTSAYTVEGRSIVW